MKTLYLDCGMGAAGDMLAGALLELVSNREEFLTKLNSLNIPDVEISSEVSEKCGILGTHFKVLIHGQEEDEIHAHSHVHSHCHEEAHTHEHSHTHGENHTHVHDHTHGENHTHVHDHTHGENHTHVHDHMHDEGHMHAHTHHHSGMHEIEHIIEKIPVPENVKNNILSVYRLIAEAESKAHGVPVENIHFHEVGTMDAIADITSVCLLMDYLAPDQVIVSPVHVGSGSVQCAHGILPVPAPATAYILRDVPIYGGSIKSELCTPTGAALLRHFADHFGDMPVMRTEKIGYGMGKKNFDAANCVRAMLGESEDTGDVITELLCNLDDMTPEAIGFAEERLFDAGALDVYTVPIQMKKSRPGIQLSVLCHERDKSNIIRLIFQHTSTIGIRENNLKRYTLSRSTETVSTEYGNIRKKVSNGYGVKREKYEYEDIARIARENNMGFQEMITRIDQKIKE